MSLDFLLALVSGGLTLLALAVAAGALAICIDVARRQHLRPAEVNDDAAPHQEAA